MLQKDQINGTCVCWKQVFNNQKCCGSIPSPSNRHQDVNQQGGRGGKMEVKLAYKRKNFLRTHPTNAHQLEAGFCLRQASAWRACVFGLQATTLNSLLCKCIFSIAVLLY
ncbi:hypothetical protein FQA47_000439 [Oryzias melastigma]|uniref:Uncharacterized protein n=1 Tax=Oryzias melastigma TaxID=30732 RepID=A0A834CK97_ORYME|nr:hypothetical protein FQA47_000439 [Oryzias melastigma]